MRFSLGLQLSFGAEPSYSAWGGVSRRLLNSNSSGTCVRLSSVLVRALEYWTCDQGHRFNPRWPHCSDPGQVVHTSPAPLELRLYVAIEI